MADVVLSAALRSNLQALQLTQSLIDTTQLRLSTGKKVNSALDNPQNFFAAQSLSNRSSDLTRLLDGIGQSIQTVKAADKGTTSVTKLVEQAESIANNARAKAASGAIQAGVTGNVNIKGISDLVTAGITAADTLTLTVIDDKNDTIQLNQGNNTAGNSYAIDFRAATTALTEQQVTSTDDLIAKINGIRRNSDGSQVFDAKLDANGQLQITARDGYTFRAVASNSRVTNTLGLSKYVSNLEFADSATASGGTIVGFTASNKAVLTSLAFTDNNTSGKIALRNATLNNLRDDASATLFTGDNAGDNITLDVLLANGTKKTLSDVVGSSTIAAATIGDVVDGINSSTAINTLVKASYDETTGRFSIEALSSDVAGINIGVAGDGTATAAQANFGFGAFANTGTSPIAGTTTAGSANSASENVYFAQGSGELATLKKQYVGLLSQIDDLVDDSGYAGVNLLKGDTLKTYFNEDRSSILETEGSSLKALDLGLTSDVNFGTTTSVDALITKVKSALDSVRNFGSTLANDLSIIQTREEFTKGLVETLKEGSDKLTLADQNEEGAKLLSLQTRQSLGITSLSLASQAQQAILRLF